MQVKFFNRLLGGKMDEIQKTSKKVDFNNLTYYLKGPVIAPINFKDLQVCYIFLKK